MYTQDLLNKKDTRGPRPMASHLHVPSSGPSLHSAASADMHRDAQEVLAKEMRTLRGQLRNLVRKGKARSQMNADVTFALLAQAWPASDDAGSFAARHPVTSGATWPTTLATLRERYAATEATTLEAIKAGLGGLPATALRKAAKFKQDRSLREWVAVQNEVKGVAPTSALVRRHLSGNAAGFQALGRQAWTERRAHASTKWIQRFRHRWALKRGVFPAREKIPVETLRVKAGTISRQENWYPEPAGNRPENPPRGPQMRNPWRYPKTGTAEER